MDLLKKVEKALSELEENREMEIPVVLTFAELRGIRRDVLVAEYGNQLAGENLRAGMARLDSRRKGGKIC